jgi:hypothetical protein
MYIYFRYTLRIVKRILPLFLPVFLLVFATQAGFGEQTSFRTVKLPLPKGRLVKAVLTFSDNHKAVEVQPAKGTEISVPYAQIEKVAYEYTLQVMGGKEHWLKIDYNAPDGHKILLIHMSGHDYIKILDSLKAHTGIDAEVLGNADRGFK